MNNSITKYSEGLYFPEQSLLVLFVLEITSFYCIFLNFSSFEKSPSFCSCDKSSDKSENDEYNKIIINKKMKKQELLNNIKKIQNEIKNDILEREKNQKKLEENTIEIKGIYINKEKIIYNLYLKRKYEIIINAYNNIDNEIEECKNKLKKRKDELEKLQNFVKDTKKLSEIYTLLDGKKLKINCIYLDKNINGEEDFSSSYEFFKLLKNSIDGVFFGIKDVKDLHLLLAQPTEFKFILIYAGDDSEDDLNFFQNYHSKFAEIIIFAIDKNEIVKLKEFNNVIAVESDY